MTDEDKADDVQPSKANLDDAFNDKEDDEAEVEAQPAKKPDQKSEEQGEDEAEDAESEDAETPAAESEDEEKSVPVAALQAERKKRQAAEAERDELKKKDAPEDEAEPDVDQKLFAERTNMSREVMMELKPDYQEKENIFIELAKASPHLTAEMMRSSNPAKFAYNKAVEHLEVEDLKKLKDSDEYKEFLKAKAEGKLKKPVEETPEAKRKKTVLAVPNLNKAASMSSNSTPKENLETLNEMFED